MIVKVTITYQYTVDIDETHELTARNDAEVAAYQSIHCPEAWRDNLNIESCEWDDKTVTSYIEEGAEE